MYGQVNIPTFKEIVCVEARNGAMRIKRETSGLLGIE